MWITTCLKKRIGLDRDEKPAEERREERQWGKRVRKRRRWQDPRRERVRREEPKRRWKTAAATLYILLLLPKDESRIEEEGRKESVKREWVCGGFRNFFSDKEVEKMEGFLSVFIYLFVCLIYWFTELTGSFLKKIVVTRMLIYRFSNFKLIRDYYLCKCLWIGVLLPTMFCKLLSFE